MGTKGEGTSSETLPLRLYPHFHFHWAGLRSEKLPNKGRRRRRERDPLEGQRLHCVVPKITHTFCNEHSIKRELQDYVKFSFVLIFKKDAVLFCLIIEFLSPCFHVLLFAV